MIIAVITTPGVVMIFNIISINQYIKKNIDLSDFKDYPDFSVVSLFTVFLVGYVWILSSTMRKSLISNIITQISGKLDQTFEIKSRLRDVKLALHEKYG